MQYLMYLQRQEAAKEAEQSLARRSAATLTADVDPGEGADLFSAIARGEKPTSMGPSRRAQLFKEAETAPQEAIMTEGDEDTPNEPGPLAHRYGLVPFVGDDRPMNPAISEAFKLAKARREGGFAETRGTARETAVGAEEGAGLTEKDRTGRAGREAEALLLKQLGEPVTGAMGQRIESLGDMALAGQLKRESSPQGQALAKILQGRSIEEARAQYDALMPSVIQQTRSIQAIMTDEINKRNTYSAVLAGGEDQTAGRAKAALGIIGEMREMSSKINTGSGFNQYISGKARGVMSELGYDDPVREFNKKRYLLASSFATMIQGSRPSDIDLKIYAEATPDASWSKEAARAMWESLENVAREAALSGGLTEDQINGLLEKGRALQQRSPEDLAQKLEEASQIRGAEVAEPSVGGPGIGGPLTTDSGAVIRWPGGPGG